MEIMETVSNKNKYSPTELRNFEKIIVKKLNKAKEELDDIMGMLCGDMDNSSNNNIKMIEDSSEITEKENMSQLAARQKKFIKELDAALVRIKNGTYGVCIVTGDLIELERLLAVPHTRHSLKAKPEGR